MARCTICSQPGGGQEYVGRKPTAVCRMTAEKASVASLACAGAAGARRVDDAEQHAGDEQGGADGHQRMEDPQAHQEVLAGRSVGLDGGEQRGVERGLSRENRIAEGSDCAGHAGEQQGGQGDTEQQDARRAQRRGDGTAPRRRRRGRRTHRRWRRRGQANERGGGGEQERRWPGATRPPGRAPPEASFTTRWRLHPATRRARLRQSGRTAPAARRGKDAPAEAGRAHTTSARANRTDKPLIRRWVYSITVFSAGAEERARRCRPASGCHSRCPSR